MSRGKDRRVAVISIGKRVAVISIDQKGSCDFHRQSLRPTRMTDAYRGGGGGGSEDHQMIMVTIKRVRTTWVAVTYKGRVLGLPGCCGDYMCNGCKGHSSRLKTNRVL